MLVMVMYYHLLIACIGPFERLSSHLRTRLGHTCHSLGLRTPGSVDTALPGTHATVLNTNVVEHVSTIYKTKHNTQ